MDPQLSTTSADSPFEELGRTGETLPDDLRARILALGAAAVPPLLALLADDDAAAEDASGEGWPPIHAVDLLTDLRAEEAIVPMLVALRGSDFDDILSSRIAVRLPSFGAAALEPTLAELSNTGDSERAVTLCAILARLGVKDERVWMALAKCFDEEPHLSAGFLASYGDDRALPLIEREIFAFDESARGSLARLDLDLLIEAYEELAGELPDDLSDQVEYLWELQSEPDDLPVSPPPTVTIKVGRTSHARAVVAKSTNAAAWCEPHAARSSSAGRVSSAESGALQCRRRPAKGDHRELRSS